MTTPAHGPLNHRLTLTVDLGTGEPAEAVIARILNVILTEITVGGAEITKLAVEMTSPQRTR
jgi:hypothetical protein